MMLSNLEKEDIILKAKSTPYKHSHWFTEGGKSVYDAVSYFTESNGFYLDTVRLKGPHETLGFVQTTGKHNFSREEIVNWFISKGAYDKLVIRYGSSKQPGSDRGILKIKTYLVLNGLL